MGHLAAVRQRLATALNIHGSLSPKPMSSYLSIIIINYHTADVILECLEAIQKADWPPSSALSPHIEIILIDNASKDISLEQIKDWLEQKSNLTPLKTFKLIENEQNLGFPKACNQGLKEAQGDYILFLNPDSILNPENLCQLYDITLSYPNTAMFGPYIYNEDGSEQAGARRLLPTPERLWPQILGLPRISKRFRAMNLHQEALPAEVASPVEAISGSCMLLKRDKLLALGAWDERYFMHWEDLDLCMRLNQAGEEILFLKDVRVLHYKSVSSRSIPLKVLWHKHLSMIHFYQKFFSHYALPLRFGLYGLIYIRFLLFATKELIFKN
ncbi:MAG: glycosyltransferase family 2 protein [Deinococcales bacterium]